jgi:hypothetical protein
MTNPEGLFFAEGVQLDLPISLLAGWTKYYHAPYRFCGVQKQNLLRFMQWFPFEIQTEYFKNAALLAEVFLIDLHVL